MKTSLFLNTQFAKKVYAKILYIFLLLVCASFFVSETKAQNPESVLRKQVSLADSAILKNDSLSIEEKLVLLALNSPVYKASENQSKINEYQLKAAKNQWVNLLTLSANLNDQNFLTQSQTNYAVYPKYFFGVTIPLGTILSRTTVKSAKQQVEISQYNREQLARNIRAEILSKYQKYKNYAELLAIQNEILDNEETAYLQAKEKFRNGVISIDVFNIAQKLYNLELSKKLNLQLDQDLIKIDIESMIGVNLNSVLNK